MVTTRSKIAKNVLTETNTMDRNRDTESEGSVLDLLTRDQLNEFDIGDLFNYRDDTERHVVNQRFSEINKHISELTSLVLDLTEKISSSNREGNGLNTVSYGNETRSDNWPGQSSH